MQEIANHSQTTPLKRWLCIIQVQITWARFYYCQSFI